MTKRVSQKLGRIGDGTGEGSALEAAFEAQKIEPAPEEVETRVLKWGAGLLR
jgi:hypothetical protein